jgi:hypothetical protein
MDGAYEMADTAEMVDGDQVPRSQGQILGTNVLVDDDDDADDNDDHLVESDIDHDYDDYNTISNIICRYL